MTNTPHKDTEGIRGPTDHDIGAMKAMVNGTLNDQAALAILRMVNLIQDPQWMAAFDAVNEGNK